MEGLLEEPEYANLSGDRLDELEARIDVRVTGDAATFACARRGRGAALHRFAETGRVSRNARALRASSEGLTTGPDEAVSNEPRGFGNDRQENGKARGPLRRARIPRQRAKW